LSLPLSSIHEFDKGFDEGWDKGSQPR
jgi:hypothetical protein